MNLTSGLRIAAAGSALPEKIYSNDDLKQYMDTNDDWIFQRTGIHERRFCDPELKESSTSLACLAADKAVRKAEKSIAGFDRSQIGAVLATSCSAEYILPSIASLVQSHLGLPKETLTFDMNAACSGFIYGLITGRALLLSGAYRYILLVSSEQLSRQLDLTDRGTGILFGDGAGAVLLEQDNDADALPFTANAFSEGNAEVIYCPSAGDGTLNSNIGNGTLSSNAANVSLSSNAANGSLNPNAASETSSTEASGRSQLIHMNGHDVFRFAVSAIQESINRLLKDSGLSLDEIDYVLCHQANARIIDYVKKKYPGYEDKFLMNICHYGNTSSASIPILMDEMLENGTLRPGNRVICVGFGAGLAWGGAMIRL